MEHSEPITAGPRDEPWVVIDGMCSFCSTSTDWLAGRLHRPDRTDPRRVPYQFLELESFGLTAERTEREMIWIPAGDAVPDKLAGGADAFAAWLRYAGGPYRILGRAMTTAPVRPLAWLVYRLVAANRDRLPGGTPMCKR